MNYSSEQSKNDYKKYIPQRKTNLIRLREKIANMNQAAFAKDIDITAKDISTIENGEKNLSLFHIQAYRKYFMENYNLDVSVDYLMGYTNVIENRSMNISNELGLTGESIEMLKLMNDKKNTLYPENKKNLLMLNFILSSLYDDTERPNIRLYSTILCKMWEYITTNSKDVGYYAPNESGEYVVKKKLHLINEEHIKNEDIGISPQIALGDLYKYQLERELLDNIKDLERILKAQSQK